MKTINLKRSAIALLLCLCSVFGMVAVLGTSAQAVDTIVSPSSPVTPTVNIPALPVAKIQYVMTPSVQATANSKATFTVKATNAKSYQWQYYTGSAWKNVSSSNATAKKATLKVDATVKTNGTKYRCIVTGTDGKTVTSSTIAMIVTGWYNPDYYGKSSNYLKATKYCQVNNTTIKKVAQTGVGKAKTPLDAAKNLFKYLNKNTSYKYYYDTKYGAVGTWNNRKGNCADLAHLAVACARSVGIPARYVHASGCKFRDGDICGHYWAQWYIGGKWYNVDLTSDSNTFNCKANNHYGGYNTFVNHKNGHVNKRMVELAC